MNQTTPPYLARLVLLGAALALAACGSRAPRLEPPRVKLVALAVQDQSRFDLDLRLSNPAARQMNVNRVRLEIRIDGEPLAPVEPEFSGMLPALGEELLSVSGELPEAVIRQLRPLAEGRRSQLPLEISGEVLHSDGMSFDVEQSGWLSATPGRPWQFR